MARVFAVTLFMVASILAVSMLFSYFFAMAGGEEHAWWTRCQEKLARMRSLIQRRGSVR